MSDSVLDLHLHQAHQALQQGKVNTVELVEHALERAHEVRHYTNAFVQIHSFPAMARAQALKNQPVTTRLQGIPLAHKDCLAHAGQTMGVGSPLQRQPAHIDSTAISRLQEQGAIEIGTLHLSEVIAGPSGNNVFLGDCHNAWNAAYISGGSSSGSAVAVATGSVYAALGTDTGGSVRIPAALNGLFGVKPTFGRVSRYGAFPRSASSDVLGPLARSAKDCAIVLDTIAGPDPYDSDTMGIPKPDYVAGLEQAHEGSRLGVFQTGTDIDEDVQTCFEHLLSLASSKWGQLVNRHSDDWQQLYALGDVLSKVEAAQVHSASMADQPEQYSKGVFTRTEPGLLLPATRYIETQQLRPLLMQRFVQQAFAQVDVLLLPTLPICTPLIKDIDMEAQGQVHHLVPRLTRLTRPFSYLGLPVVSMPMGLDSRGMPVGVQLVGRPYAESRLLSVAHHLSLLLDWSFKPSQLMRQLKESAHASP
ncbi:amidase [Alcaligenes endophyticus]|uniref:Amidase n=1 Tax=Alcaligenes endophyticus TaxID=1929088 RepID=A0ABT8EJH3_9BURK|nr:amidase [Alcaligenes endophyticus]MCX5591761.1 amidase [Alcaligenes endophyticus]MDN4121438.1 amidase [Alcaligenes endophyticus]